MAPHKDHVGSVVSAHSLSIGAMLRKIAVDSQVYANVQAKQKIGEAWPFKIKKHGLRDVSVFNGFCRKHDRELFSCLENEAFRFTHKQIFMLAYWATARECYMKRAQCEALHTAEEIAAIHGINGSVRLNDPVARFQMECLRGAEEVESFKSTLDRHLIQKSWGRLVTQAIMFPETPSVLATTVFQPYFDMNGVQLQDYENLAAEMSHLCMSVIPLDKGGAAIFSWLDSTNAAPERFFRSVAEADDLTSSVIHAIFDNTENFAISPAWYEQLTQDKKDYLFSRMMNPELNVAYAENKRPDQSAPWLDHWGEGSIATF